jgi:hypothetical protein
MAMVDETYDWFRTRFHRRWNRFPPTRQD